MQFISRETPSTASEEQLQVGGGVGGTQYSGSRRTKILVHGFTHHGHRQWLLNLATALLNKVWLLNLATTLLNKVWLLNLATALLNKVWLCSVCT